MRHAFRNWLAMVAALWILPVCGAQFVPLTLAELTAKADLVVRGKVRSLTGAEDDAGRVFTRVELEVAEVWKGPRQPAVLEVVHGGGSVGKKRVVVSGQVQYRPGEEVVAFLVFNPRGQAVTLGLAQGKFQVWADPQTGEKLAANLFHGTAPGGAAARPLEAKPAGDRLTLSGLKHQVQGGAQ